MRTIGLFLSMVILALLISAIAIISIQNIEIVSLKFLLWESVKLPFGVLLALAISFGLIIGSFFPIGEKR
jgi:lipopolysaccharide assembly protein A